MMDEHGNWSELAAWFRAMTREKLEQELVLVEREYAHAGDAARKVIGEQLAVLKAEIATRGNGAAVVSLPGTGASGQQSPRAGRDVKDSGCTALS